MSFFSCFFLFFFLSRHCTDKEKKSEPPSVSEILLLIIIARCFKAAGVTSRKECGQPPKPLLIPGYLHLCVACITHSGA